MTKKRTEPEKAAELLGAAQDALNQGDIVGMLSALIESGYLDGIRRRLQREWRNSLPLEELDLCVAHAVDSACSAAGSGRRVRNLGPWLWKAAENTARDRWSLDFAHRAELDETVRRTEGEVRETDTERAERLDLAEVRRKKAVQIARELLPRIGRGQILNVMELVIQAVEDQRHDLPASSIAETLDISPKAVRSLVSRGLRRLRRLAEEEGVEFPMALSDTDSNTEE